MSSIVTKFLSATRSFLQPAVATAEEGVLVEPTTPTRTFRADSRLSRARKCEAGIYRLYLEDGAKIIFKVWSVKHRESGHLIVRVFPVSFYDADGVLVKRVVRSEGSVCPYFSRAILRGHWNPERIPDAHREELEFWAPLFRDGVVCYENQSNQRRSSDA